MKIPGMGNLMKLLFIIIKTIFFENQLYFGIWGLEGGSFYHINASNYSMTTLINNHNNYHHHSARRQSVTYDILPFKISNFMSRQSSAPRLHLRNKRAATMAEFMDNKTDTKKKLTSRKGTSIYELIDFLSSTIIPPSLAKFTSNPGASKPAENESSLQELRYNILLNVSVIPSTSSNNSNSNNNNINSYSSLTSLLMLGGEVGQENMAKNKSYGGGAFENEDPTISLFDHFNKRRFSSSIEHVLVLIYTLVSFIGTLGNGLVLYILSRNQRMRRSPRNAFIGNLAVSDLILCLFTSPFTIYSLVHKDWAMGLFMCKFISSLQATNVFVSTMSITAIAVDRHQVILYPTSNLAAGATTTNNTLKHRISRDTVTGNSCKTRPRHPSQSNTTIVSEPLVLKKHRFKHGASDWRNCKSSFNRWNLLLGYRPFFCFRKNNDDIAFPSPQHSSQPTPRDHLCMNGSVRPNSTRKCMMIKRTNKNILSPFLSSPSSIFRSRSRTKDNNTTERRYPSQDGGLSKFRHSLTDFNVLQLPAGGISKISFCCCGNHRPLSVIGGLITVWSVSLIMAMPLFIYHSVMRIDLFNYDICYENWPSGTRGRTLYSLSSLFFQYVLPILVVTVSYIRIALKLKAQESIRKKRHNHNIPAEGKEEALLQRKQLGFLNWISATARGKRNNNNNDYRTSISLNNTFRNPSKINQRPAGDISSSNLEVSPDKILKDSFNLLSNLKKTHDTDCNNDNGYNQNKTSTAKVKFHGDPPTSSPKSCSVEESVNPIIKSSMASELKQPNSSPVYKNPVPATTTGHSPNPNNNNNNNFVFGDDFGSADMIKFSREGEFSSVIEPLLATSPTTKNDQQSSHTQPQRLVKYEQKYGEKTQKTRLLNENHRLATLPIPIYHLAAEDSFVSTNSVSAATHAKKSIAPSANKKVVSGSSGSDQRTAKNRKTNILLMSIALVFAVSWLPLNLFNVVSDIESISSSNIFQSLNIPLIYACCHLFGMSSACTNPILYGWLNENFKKEFKAILFNFQRWCRAQNFRSSSSFTRSKSTNHSLKQPTRTMSKKS